jgi:very-short-patch-repair endonuclease
VVWIVVVLLVLAGAIWIIREITAGDTPQVNSWPLEAKPLLTEREQLFYLRLVALYPEYIVLAQVALSQLLGVKAGTPNGQSIRNRYQQLVADFVVCRRDFTTVAVIELDDSSHAALKRLDADQRKTSAVEASGLRLVRIPAGRIPSDPEIQQILQVGASLSAPNATAHSIVQRGISRETTSILRTLLNIALVGVVLAGAWSLYSMAVSSLPKAMIPPAIAPAPVAAAKPPIPASAPVSLAPVQAAEQKRAEAARALAAQQAAWANYYQPPAACEHPPTWQDQVECGNQFIRAKREFEQKWSAQSSSQPAK